MQWRDILVQAAACCGLMMSLPSALAATEVNLANQAELEQLKGIGPQLCSRILEERAQHGHFSSWDDFMRRMKGVGPATAKRLSEGGLLVAGQPLSAAAPSLAPAEATGGAASSAVPPLRP